jgi:hypothetical protein
MLSSAVSGPGAATAWARASEAPETLNVESLPPAPFATRRTPAASTRPGLLISMGFRPIATHDYRVS